jgi:hypothetical protein
MSRDKLLRRRANIGIINRPHPLSVPQAAVALQSSQAYVRRLLISRRLYGVKVGPVWAIYPEDLESFQRLRRRPGRPQGTGIRALDEAEMRVRINSERASAGTARALRQRPRKQIESSEQA